MASHLVAAGLLMEDDPESGVAHARFAARRGGRVGVVRETYGIAAYRVGDFATAVRELRTAVRITGRYDLLPMIADCERGLGRPEKALDIAVSAEAEKLDTASTVEMMIVVAGAYADTGDMATALASLEVPALRQKVDGKWQVRLWVAYADLLELAGRTEESLRWLTLAADADTERLTDAADRLGRPAPVVEDPSWSDDEQISVIDAFVEETEPEENALQENELDESDESEFADASAEIADPDDDSAPAEPELVREDAAAEDFAAEDVPEEAVDGDAADDDADHTEAASTDTGDIAEQESADEAGAPRTDDQEHA
ncbi:tetratricopeptide repeat protein [Brachybacterium huguangmaarense]